MIEINYTIKNDIIFSFLFSQKDILKDFLEACLNIEIQEVEVTNQFSPSKIRYRNKGFVLDIKAVIDDKIVNIEMQNKSQDFYKQRSLSYAGVLLSGQLVRGEKYESLRDVIVINILNFDIFPETKDIHTTWKFAEKKHPELGNLEGLEIHFLELEKFRKSNPDLEDKLNQWLALVDTENKEWLEVAMEKNKNIKKAIKEVDEFMSDDDIKDMIEAEKKWEMDFNSAVSDARRHGLNEGISQGISQGISKGIRKGRLETAKKMLKMNMDIKQIAIATELTEEEILSLKIKNN